MTHTQEQERCPQCSLAGYVVRDELGNHCMFCGTRWPYPLVNPSIPPSEAMMDRIDARFEKEGTPNV